MGTRKCQNPTSQSLTLDQKTKIDFCLFFSLSFAGVGWYDKWGGEKRRNILQGETHNQLPSLPTFLSCFCDQYKYKALKIRVWGAINNLLIPNLAGLLYARLEEIQGGGRGGVHQGYVQGGQALLGSKREMCVNWFSVYVWHRPSSRRLQGKEIQGAIPLHVKLQLTFKSYSLNFYPTRSIWCPGVRL